MDSRRALARTHYAELAKIGKALASPVRLQLVDLLRQGPRSVESLAEQAGISVANASQHLQQLSAARLVRSDKRAQRVVYSIDRDPVAKLYGSIRELAELVLPEMDRLRDELEVLDDDERDVLLDRIKGGQVTLIDVRPADEYQAGHIPGAISLPLEELPDRIGELPKKREIVAYCRGPYCPFALEAVAMLEAAGFKARHLDLGPPDLARRKSARRKKR
jgi:rhodanese-related sulfurtransferase/predicted transcriptional regulator